MNDMTNSARRSAGARMLWTIGLASRTTPALIWENAAGEQRRFTFSDIARLTDKFGNMLRGHGIEKGDRVIIMFPRIPEWAIAMVGALKIGAIPIPLTARDIEYRVRNADAKAAVCRATEVKGRNQYPVWALELGGLLFLKCLLVHAEP